MQDQPVIVIGVPISYEVGTPSPFASMFLLCLGMLIMARRVRDWRSNR